MYSRNLKYFMITSWKVHLSLLLAKPKDGLKNLSLKLKTPKEFGWTTFLKAIFQQNLAVRILSALMLFIVEVRDLRVPGLFYAEDSPNNAKLVERIGTASSLGKIESRGLEGLSRRER
ncbi:uncharacterized protein EV154DRAFT_482811 [Mucor mucedo]|uniref:uncharacterized protein n=1 Tax=Mucor mucedo TaxID=29922 RepID=UPI00221F2D74|nr:uncharacterized protein EV154DRAFT_482811 [Mucor mucedo]KAI7889797.1 hypothetical protein EV154DRAFT_482811 [Mucor mucedo]